MGSDGSAASGRKSDLSEWQRSTDAKAQRHRRQMSGTATGERWERCQRQENRVNPYVSPPKGSTLFVLCGFKTCSVQDDNTPHQTALRYGVDALLRPVDPGEGRVLAG